MQHVLTHKPCFICISPVKTYHATTTLYKYIFYSEDGLSVAETALVDKDWIQNMWTYLESTRNQDTEHGEQLLDAKNASFMGP